MASEDLKRGYQEYHDSAQSPRARSSTEMAVQRPRHTSPMHLIGEENPVQHSNSLSALGDDKLVMPGKPASFLFGPGSTQRQHDATLSSQSIMGQVGGSSQPAPNDGSIFSDGRAMSPVPSRGRQPYLQSNQQHRTTSLSSSQSSLDGSLRRPFQQSTPRQVGNRQVSRQPPGAAQRRPIPRSNYRISPSPLSRKRPQHLIVEEFSDNEEDLTALVKKTKRTSQTPHLSSPVTQPGPFQFHDILPSAAPQSIPSKTQKSVTPSTFHDYNDVEMIDLTNTGATEPFQAVAAPPVVSKPRTTKPVSIFGYANLFTNASQAETSPQVPETPTSIFGSIFSRKKTTTPAPQIKPVPMPMNVDNFHLNLHRRGSIKSNGQDSEQSHGDTRPLFVAQNIEPHGKNSARASYDSDNLFHDAVEDSMMASQEDVSFMGGLGLSMVAPKESEESRKKREAAARAEGHRRRQLAAAEKLARKEALVEEKAKKIQAQREKTQQEHIAREAAEAEKKAKREAAKKEKREREIAEKAEKKRQAATLMEKHRHEAERVAEAKAKRKRQEVVSDQPEAGVLKTIITERHNTKQLASNLHASKNATGEYKMAQPSTVKQLDSTEDLEIHDASLFVTHKPVAPPDLERRPTIDGQRLSFHPSLSFDGKSGLGISGLKSKHRTPVRPHDIPLPSIETDPFSSFTQSSLAPPSPSAQTLSGNTSFETAPEAPHNFEVDNALFDETPEEGSCETKVKVKDTSSETTGNTDVSSQPFTPATQFATKKSENHKDNELLPMPTALPSTNLSTVRNVTQHKTQLISVEAVEELENANNQAKAQAMKFVPKKPAVKKPASQQLGTDKPPPKKPKPTEEQKAARRKGPLTEEEKEERKKGRASAVKAEQAWVKKRRQLIADANSHGNSIIEIELQQKLAKFMEQREQRISKRRKTPQPEKKTNNEDMALLPSYPLPSGSQAFLPKLHLKENELVIEDGRTGEEIAISERNMSEGDRVRKQAADRMRADLNAVGLVNGHEFRNAANIQAVADLSDESEEDPWDTDEEPDYEFEAEPEAEPETTLQEAEEEEKNAEEEDFTFADPAYNPGDPLTITVKLRETAEEEGCLIHVYTVWEASSNDNFEARDHHQVKHEVKRIFSFQEANAFVFDRMIQTRSKGCRSITEETDLDGLKSYIVYFDEYNLDIKYCWIEITTILREKISTQEKKSIKPRYPPAYIVWKYTTQELPPDSNGKIHVEHKKPVKLNTLSDREMANQDACTKLCELIQPKDSRIDNIIKWQEICQELRGLKDEANAENVLWDVEIPEGYVEWLPGWTVQVLVERMEVLGPAN